MNFKKLSIGTWMQLNDPSIAEILSFSGYDWITLDLEHGQISDNKLTDHIRAIELNKCIPFVRLKSSNQQNIQTAIEAGAHGLIFPQIKSAEELTKLIEFSKLPPIGKRNIGYSRANFFGNIFNEYLNNKSAPYIIAMIENKEALEDIENILVVDHLDAIFVGPYDLSASLDVLGEFENIRYKNAIKKIIKSSKSFDIPCGIHVIKPSKKELQYRIKQGFKFIAYSMDSVFLSEAVKKPL